MKHTRDNPGRRGFTLVELLVVISIIAALAIMMLPGVKSLLSAGAETQARALVSSMLGTARGLAIERQAYTLVHFQIGTTDGRCWAGIFVLDTNPLSATYRKFVPSDKYAPQALPGDYACAEVSNTWCVPDGGSSRASHYNPVQNNFDPGRMDLCNLTCVNIVFAPDGSLAIQVRDPATNQWTDPALDLTAPIFTDPDARVRVWDVANRNINKAGVRAATLFSYKAIQPLSNADYSTAGSRANYLETNCAYLCINPASGQLIRSK